jgi:predicted ArsR family transcriptional regulator
MTPNQRAILVLLASLDPEESFSALRIARELNRSEQGVTRTLVSLADQDLVQYYLLGGIRFFSLTSKGRQAP